MVSASIRPAMNPPKHVEEAANLPDDFRPGSIYNTQGELNLLQLTALQQQGFPPGLAKEIGRNKLLFPLRFWIIDNSGSMRSADGNQLRGTQEKLRVVDCTRWKELQDSVDYHIQMAGLMQSTTIFRLLNRPSLEMGGEKNQEFTIAAYSIENEDDIAADVEHAQNLMKRCEPRGVTPLTEHLLDIRGRLQQVEAKLRSAGQKAVLIIATDGMPSDGRGATTDQVLKDFTRALKSLQELPVWIVIRLCTNEAETVEYYNNLDKILNLPLDVIDDFFNEAPEVGRWNKWMNYTLQLHRCREMGYQHRVFDSLDERTLTHDELLEYVQLLFGKEAFKDVPDIHTNWRGFSNALAKINQAAGKQYNPNKKRMDTWIDMNELDKTYAVRRFSFFNRKKADSKRSVVKNEG